MNTPKPSSSNSSSATSLNIAGNAGPDVPVFTCLIYTRSGADGKVHARIANYAGIELSAATERDALARITKAFKSQLQEKAAAGEKVQLIDSPAPPNEDEKVRSIPVHL